MTNKGKIGREDSAIKYIESVDDASVETGKNYHRRVRDEDDESTDAEE